MRVQVSVSEDESNVDNDKKEVIRADNESINDANELAIDDLDITDLVIEALAKRGIIQLFSIHVQFMRQF